jgi:hydroxymethylbilane synthase
MTTELCIATRGSKLALWQAEYIRTELQRREPGLRVELLVLKTQGDRVLDRALSEIGGKGLFTKEIEDALLDGRAQIAVHSMKDLPAHGPPGLLVAAVPERADPRDALLLAPAHAHLAADLPAALAATTLLQRLPAGARLGTSSLRRVCQVRRLRPDLTIVPLRGNVDTRLRKLHEGELDAAVLAAAGLSRLGFAAHIAACFAATEMMPACGQGALAVQCRTDDPRTLARLGALADWSTTAATAAERAFSLRLGGSCQTPLGAHAQLAQKIDEVPADAAAPGTVRLRLAGMVGSVDGTRVLRGEREGLVQLGHLPEVPGGAELGTALAEELLAQGAGELLR